MKVLTLALILALGPTGSAFAQSLAGTWQGATGPQQRVLIISNDATGALRGAFYTLGTDRAINPASHIAVHGKDVAFDLDNVLGTFTGVLSPDGKSIAGTWQTQGPAQVLTLTRVSSKDAWVIDPSPHKTRFVSVDRDVRLEVLDWGGSGPPLVFLAGLGNSAHVFDTLAPKFTDKHHVYGITRRGFGASSMPAPTDENYDADRLGDDVLTVIDALKLEQPIIVGHSVAGEELSSIGARHPEKVRALIYLEAAYRYAFYNPDSAGEDSADVNASDLRRALGQLDKLGRTPARMHQQIQYIEGAMAHLQTVLQAADKVIAGLPEPAQRPRVVPQDLISNAILSNERKYAAVTVPTLAIMAVPHQCELHCNDSEAKADATIGTVQTDAFEAATPSAHVVRLPYANHFVWRTNEADVLREMNAFLDALPAKPSK